MASTSTLSNLTPAHLKGLKANILTEHFGWGPESFAKQGMDLANVVMYGATEAVEASLMDKCRTDQAAGEVVLDEEEVQKGIYRMETLLESAIDKHFDLFEIYVLRNTFTLQTELIPYLALEHHASLGEAARGVDEAAVEEYERELRLYEEELTKERELAAVQEFVRRKLEDAQERAEEVGYMRGAEPLNSRTHGLVTQLSLLQKGVAALLATPAPPRRQASDVNPWATSRSTFVNWAASCKVDALGAVPDDAPATDYHAVDSKISTAGHHADALALTALLDT